MFREQERGGRDREAALALRHDLLVRAEAACSLARELCAEAALLIEKADLDRWVASQTSKSAWLLETGGFLLTRPVSCKRARIESGGRVAIRLALAGSQPGRGFAL